MRKCELYSKPLTPQGIFAQILIGDGIAMTDREYEKYLKFFNRTYFGKKLKKRQVVLVAKAAKEKERLAKAKKKDVKKKEAMEN